MVGLPVGLPAWRRWKYNHLSPQLKLKLGLGLSLAIKVLKYMNGPQSSFETYSKPKNSQSGPKKAKNNSKIMSISKVRIEGTIKKIRMLKLHE